MQRSLSSDDNAADGVPVTERVRNSLLHNPTEKVNKTHMGRDAQCGRIARFAALWDVWAEGLRDTGESGRGGGG